MTDVSIHDDVPAPVADALLARNATNTDYENRLFSTSDFTSLAVDDYARFNGTDWANRTIAQVQVDMGIGTDLLALEALSGTGLAARTGAGTWAERTITGGATLSVADGDGVAGNPTLAVLPAGVDHNSLLNFDAGEHFTEASIDHAAILNIGSNSHATIDTHLAATAAHGATGAVVGTTNTQTLTNKTLDSFTNLVHADSLHVQIRNQSGGAMAIGDVVYVSGYSVGQDLALGNFADASGSGTMPAIAILDEATLANNANGQFTEAGRVIDMDTSAWSVGDELYVSAVGTTGNTLTNVKPTGTDLIQKVGLVLRDHATLGVIEFFGAGRSNDLPNIATDNLWVGDGSAVPTATGSTGTGLVVRQGSPSITTPTIASFAGAAHDHADAAGGAQITATTGLADFKANSILGNDSASATAPQILDELDIATASPVGADFLLGWTAAGLLRKYTVTSLPGGSEVNDLETSCQDILVNEIAVGSGTDTAAYVDELTLNAETVVGGDFLIGWTAAGVISRFTVSDLPAGAQSLDAAYNGGRSVTVDAGAVELITAANLPSVDIRQAADTTMRMRLSQDAAGDPQIEFGPGGVTATDTILQRTAVGVLDLTSILDVATGLRVAGAAATGNYLRGNGTNFISAGLGIVDDTTPQLGAQLDVNGFAIGDGTLELLTFVETASAINNLEVVNAITAQRPILRVNQTEADIGIRIMDSDADMLLDLIAGVGANTTYIQIESEVTGIFGPIIRSFGETNVDLNFETAGTGVFNFNGVPMLDTNISAVANGDILYYDGVTDNAWENLGVGAAGTYLQGGALPAYAALDLTDAAQISGFTGTTPGNLVVSNSPTIVTPTIASFANAAHDHSDAAGGAQITATTGLADFKANSILLNDSATTAAPQIADELDIATASPAGADFILGWTAAGLLRKYTVTSLPAGSEVNDLETDGATGILANEIPVGSGAGTVVYTASTGTGNVVRATSPTIVTPTIASFASATHDHADAAGGGQFAIGNTTGTLAIARGGTGQTAAGAAFDALDPMTTQGDMMFRNATTAARLAIGTAHQHQRVNAGATAPEWYDKEEAFRFSLEAPVAGDLIFIDATNKAITVTEIQAICDDGTSVVCNVRQHTSIVAAGGTLIDQITPTAALTSETTISSAAVPADRVIFVEVGTVTGGVTSVGGKVYYTED